MMWLLGEYLMTSMADTQSFITTSGCSVAVLSTVRSPNLPPTARCEPSCEKATERQGNLTDMQRSMARVFPSHTRRMLLSAAVANRSGLVGCVATVYRSAVAPLISCCTSRTLPRPSDSGMHTPMQHPRSAQAV